MWHPRPGLTPISGKSRRWLMMAWCLFGSRTYAITLRRTLDSKFTCIYVDSLYTPWFASDSLVCKLLHDLEMTIWVVWSVEIKTCITVASWWARLRLNRLLRRRSKKTSKLCVTGLCAGNSPVIGPVTRKMFPFWWRHHGTNNGQFLWHHMKY